MARTALTVITGVHSGVPISFAAADLVNGNSMVNTGGSLLICRNTTAAAVNITLRTNHYIDGDATNGGLKCPDRVVSVPVSPAGAPAFMLGPFPTDCYNQADGTLSIDCAAALSLSVLSIQ
jgi:hypothetical protein